MAKSNPIDIRFTFSQTQEIKRFSKKQQRSILRSSLGAAAGAIKTPMRRYVKQRITRKGYLAKAITSKVKIYNNGIVILLLGARDRRLADGENPGKYFHLADLGTRRHTINARTLRIGGTQRIIRLEEPVELTHPGARAANVRADALRVGQPNLDKKLAAGYNRRLLRLIATGQASQ